QEFAPLSGRQAGPVHLLGVGSAQLAVRHTSFRATVARPLRGQPLGGPFAQELDDRRSDMRIASQIAVGGIREVRVRPIQRCAVRGHGSISMPSDGVYEAVSPF